MTRGWKPRDPFTPDTPPVHKPSRYSERDGRLVYDHPKRGTLDVSSELAAGRSKRSPAPEHDARRRTAARLASELFKKHGKNEEMLGFRDHLYETRPRSRGMNRGRAPSTRAFLSGDSVVGRVLDADERARVAGVQARASSPRRKPTMPRFSFSGKPIPEERVDELSRRELTHYVSRAAHDVHNQVRQMYTEPDDAPFNQRTGEYLSSHRARKRLHGIDRATTRLARPDAEGTGPRPRARVREERVDEWTREQAAVRRAAKTVRERSGYSIRASVNIADTKTKGGTRKLLGVEGLRKRRLRDSVREDALDELFGKGRFGEIRRHAQYTRDKPTVDRADAIVDDASRERRAELRVKSRAERRKNEDVLDEGTESYHLRLAGHHEDQASEHDKDSAKYRRHVDAANRHYEKAHQARERATRPVRSPKRRKK